LPRRCRTLSPIQATKRVTPKGVIIVLGGTRSTMVTAHKQDASPVDNQHADLGILDDAARHKSEGKGPSKAGGVSKTAKEILQA
jgi:hypothetical protein